MNKILSLIRSKPLLYGGIAVFLVAGAGLLLTRNSGSKEELLTVVRGDFVQEVSVSGKVTAAQNVDLAFDSTGRVTSVPVEVGDRVAAGQTVAAIGTDVLLADLRAAEIELEEIEREQGTLVESAYRTLLSDDLAVVPDSSYGLGVPTLTGLYRGGEGSYRIRVIAKENSSDLELRTFGLEDLGTVVIETDQPTQVGTRGLFIDFPDVLSSYEDTIWHVAIPNTKGASYLENRRAYDEALSTRDKAIANAEAKVRSIKTEIGERTLRAPFAGIVTAVKAERGAIAVSGEVAVSIQSDDTLQIESFVPEVNISQLAVGDKAKVTLDAYGADVLFEAVVVSIDPAETMRDGVSTYRAVLQFSQDDMRIKSGMTANVRIKTDEREGVFSVPQGIVTARDGKKYVPVKVGDSVEEREVTTGSVSSIGTVEILTGLSEGDIVVLSATQ